MVWALLLASAAAVLAVGLVATWLVFGGVGPRPSPRWSFWWRLAVACGLTVASLALRSLRWIFLLRRAETRIPIRDAYIGYLAGYSLLFTPLLLGEIALRALVHRRRGAVPVLTTAVVNVWERALDAAALVTIAAIGVLVAGLPSDGTVTAALAALVLLVPPVRRLALHAIVLLLSPLTRSFDAGRQASSYRGLASNRTWLTAYAASLVAWALPGLGFWLVAGAWGTAIGVAHAEQAYTASTLASGLALAPAGVLVTGPNMLAALVNAGVPEPQAALCVLGVRLATVGVSVALGLVVVVMHFRSAAALSATHFDDIAEAYDVQIPESRRLALLARKTGLMKAAIETRRAGRKGLDVGCGQGAYVGRMRDLGFDVRGIDSSPGQVRLAARNVGEGGLVRVGSVLDIPEADASFDFVYVINVLHHLNSIDEQRRAFAEIVRVLRPGGLLFVHEINTRSLLFRFYMGYVFPSLNCIDEGVERWLLPNRLHDYTSAAAVDVQYFTFFPDFIPQIFAGMLRPIERRLEESSLRVFSAHYMAVLQKDGPAEG